MALSIWDRPPGPSLLCSPLMSPDTKPPPNPFRQGMWHRLGLGRWLPKDRHRHSSSSRPVENCEIPTATSLTTDGVNDANHKGGALAPVLPRDIFKKRDSLRKDCLSFNDLDHRRAFSADRRRSIGAHRPRSQPPVTSSRFSAPEVYFYDNNDLLPVPSQGGPPPPERELREESVHNDANESVKREDVEDALEMDLESELDRKWILNLSMHFRERSDREKFFVTFAETPNRWRRVTITCDYRNAEPDSLEHDLRQLHYQRDKNARIYEAIRDSIPEIQFFDTVTNLRLETSEGRLHVHVTEDGNEIITYPPVTTFGNLTTQFIRESDISFEAHLSGFAYHVKLNGKDYVKKEITGPDTVDEFLYEINALHDLSGSKNVIQFKALVVDDRMLFVKGLLIDFAEKGALVDLFYEQKGSLSWTRRERWARQIVQGLAEIHEAGFVQGDLTISNMVVDTNDNAKIIDINRRGCPIGWEPPEFIKKLENKQRISMYIGVKSDLFQLGMALWAIAMEEDDPGRKPRPLLIPTDMKMPEYYRDIILICMSYKPQDRLSAKELLALFPPDETPIKVNEIDAKDKMDIPEITQDCLAVKRPPIPDPPKYKSPFLDQSADSRFTSRRGSATSSEEFLYFPLRQHPLPSGPYVESLPRIDVGNYYRNVESEGLYNNDEILSLSDRSVDLDQAESRVIESLQTASETLLFPEVTFESDYEQKVSPCDVMPEESYDDSAPDTSRPPTETELVESLAGTEAQSVFTTNEESEETGNMCLRPLSSDVHSCTLSVAALDDAVGPAADNNLATTRQDSSLVDMDLFTSALPINPAFEAVSKDRKQADPDQQSTPTLKSVPTHHNISPHLPDDLLMSCLPINPAFKDPSSFPNVPTGPSLPHGPSNKTPLEDPLKTPPPGLPMDEPTTLRTMELFSSRLPINPRFPLEP